MGILDELKPELFSTDLHVLDDPMHRDFVLVLHGQEVARVPYGEVYRAHLKGQTVAGLVLSRVPETTRSRALFEL